MGVWRRRRRFSDFRRAAGHRRSGGFRVAEIVDFSEFSPREFYVDKDKVFVLGHYAMTVKKTGRKAAADWIHVFTFRGGKVAKFREFTDTALFVTAYRA